MKRIGLPLVIVALLGAFLFWWFSPVQVVKRRTGTLLQTLTMESGSGKASRQAGVYSLNALLAPEVELETPTLSQANGSFERSELESAYSWLAEQAKQCRFELTGIRSIQVDGDTAVVDCEITALVELPMSKPVDGRHRASLHWSREENVWRLSKAVWSAQ